MTLDAYVRLKNIIALKGYCFKDGRFAECYKCLIAHECLSNSMSTEERYNKALRIVIDTLVDEHISE